MSDDARTSDRSNRGGPDSRSSFFDVYKAGQGKHIRTGTAVGAGVLVLAGANFVFEQLAIMVDPDRAWTSWFQMGTALLWLVGLGVLTWWLTGVNRKSCDFMIATEGEMKKVNWSTRREVMGSTKVVIAFTLLMSLLLFLVDLLFMTFFSSIGVLREVPSVLSMFTGGDV